MESFGRMIAMVVCVVGLVFFTCYQKTVAVQWQKNETVRELSQAYAERILKNKCISEKEWKTFQRQIVGLGEYQVRLTIYERKRYEDESGRVYLFSEETYGTGTQILTEGNYVRLVVTEAEKSVAETFLYGTAGKVSVGGRIP